MTNLIQLCWQHKTEIAALGAVVLSSAVHAYQIVVQAGGIRTMWSQFMGPKQSQPQPQQPQQKP
jgi:hypothetical protein